MSQPLILPINKCKLTASWKTPAYTAQFGYIHYGVDMVSQIGDRTLYASGNGTIVAVGNDSVVGNVVAVCYPGARNWVTGKTQDVVLRYYHLARMDVSKGQQVTKDTRLGVYGSTGMLSMAAHLHLEADTDTLHPLCSPTVLRSSFLCGRAVGANDKTMSNPMEWLHCKASPPDHQTYVTAEDSYIRSEDKTIAKYTV